MEKSITPTFKQKRKSEITFTPASKQKISNYVSSFVYLVIIIELNLNEQRSIMLEVFLKSPSVVPISGARGENKKMLGFNMHQYV